MQVAGAAIILVHQPGRSVAYYQSRVATRAVGNCALHMNCNLQPVTQLYLFTVGCANEVGKPKQAQTPFQLPRGKRGQQHRRTFVNVLCQPRFIQVITVLVRYV